MQKFIAAAVLTVLLIAVCIEAKPGGLRGKGRPSGKARPSGRGKPGQTGGLGGKGGRGGKGGPGFLSGDKYSWDVNVADNVISQVGFVKTDSNTVGVMTSRKNADALKEMNMTSSIIFLMADSGTMIMKFGIRGPCFQADLSATKVEIESDFAAWNNTAITFTNSVALNGTAPAEDIPDSEEFALIGKICRKKMVPTSVMTAGDEDPETKTINLLGYNSQISIMVPEMPIRGPGGRGRGGRLGGRGGRPGGRGGRGQGQGRGRGFGGLIDRANRG